MSEVLNTAGEDSSATQSNKIEQTPNAYNVRPLKRLLDRCIFVWVVLWLFFCSKALLPLLLTTDGNAGYDESQKNLIQKITMVFLSLSVYFLLFYYRGIISIFTKNVLLVAVLVLAWLSFFWSLDPDVTLRRSIILTSFTIIACGIVLKYDFGDIIRIILCLGLLIIVLSLYFIVFDPSLGFNPDGRGARGAFSHKNILSEFLLVTVVAAIVAARMRLLPRIIGYAYVLVYAVLLLMASSATAWIIAILMLGLFLLVEMRRLPFKYFAVLVAFGISLAILASSVVIINLDGFFSILDRDPTLTGRDAVWVYAGRKIAERPFFGYGYSAFWESEPNFSFVVQRLQWQITHAHNGFLQVWLELGLAGLLLLIIYLFQSLTRFLKSEPSQNLKLFIMPTLIGLLAYNMAETQLLDSKNIGWIVILICLLLTTPGLAKIRARYSGQTM